MKIKVEPKPGRLACRVEPKCYFSRENGGIHFVVSSEVGHAIRVSAYASVKLSNFQKHTKVINGSPLKYKLHLQSPNKETALCELVILEDYQEVGHYTASIETELINQ